MQFEILTGDGSGDHEYVVREARYAEPTASVVDAHLGERYSREEVWERAVGE